MSDLAIHVRGIEQTISDRNAPAIQYQTLRDNLEERFKRRPAGDNEARKVSSGR
jgi:hypothetical protein